ncbi:MAG TPA: hypothetical protein VME46_19595 [Acidimicrobiales bacterium]|nr:hypothetical protein [Acidimicrobiales bacterium]
MAAEGKRLDRWASATPGNLGQLPVQGDLLGLRPLANQELMNSPAALHVNAVVSIALMAVATVVMALVLASERLLAAGVLQWLRQADVALQLG